MKVTVEIDDELKLQAEAAAASINARRAAEQRSPLPLKLDEAEVRTIVVNYLIGLVLGDAQEQGNLDVAQVVQRRQEKLARYR